MCTFLRKTNATSVFISMMRLIFIFGFAKKYLLEEKLRPIKDEFLPSGSVVHSDHRRKYKSYYKGTMSCVYNSPPYSLCISFYDVDTPGPEGKDASLIGRNYSSNK